MINTQNISPSTLIGFDEIDKNIISYIRNFVNPSYPCYAIGCMDAYWSKAREKKRFFVGFLYMSECVEKFVDDFNKIFTNYEIEILNKVPVFIKSQRNQWDTYHYFVSKKTATVVSSAFSYLFEIKIKDKLKYDMGDVKKCSIWYIIHHLLRLFSLLENWNSLFYPNKLEYTTFEQTFNSLSLRSNSSGSRGLGTISPTYEQIYLLNNPDFIKLLPNTVIRQEQFFSYTREYILYKKFYCPDDFEGKLLISQGMSFFLVKDSRMINLCDEVRHSFYYGYTIDEILYFITSFPTYYLQKLIRDVKYIHKQYLYLIPIDKFEKIAEYVNLKLELPIELPNKEEE